MNTTTTPKLENETTLGSFSYLDTTVIPSLYRNGKVLTRRDADGSDAGMEGVSLEETEMIVHNGRSVNGDERRTLEAHGFES